MYNSFMGLIWSAVFLGGIIVPTVIAVFGIRRAIPIAVLAVVYLVIDTIFHYVR